MAAVFTHWDVCVYLLMHNGFQLGPNHCKLQLFQVLFSSIFWFLIMWLISVLKHNLHIMSLFIQWRHANSLSPYTSALYSKTGISCLGWKQNQNRGIFVAYKVAENCISKPLWIFLGVFCTLGGESYSCDSAQYWNWGWCSLYFNYAKKSWYLQSFVTSVHSAALVAKLFRPWKSLKAQLHLAMYLSL